MSVELRIKGLRSAINEKYPGLSTEVIAKTHDDDLQTYIQTQYVLNNHPDANIFFYAGAGVYGGIRAICESNRRDQIMVFAYDLYDEARKYLNEGTLIPLALYQDPYNQGYSAVKIIICYTGKALNQIFTN
ncbi:MAG: substrate-binding domain-containing protein [Clostridiaceae bacterium]|nr:substrate-binding domain-containing protein [Clostridiaceae bacterium]